MLYAFKLDHNATKATTIFCTKDEGTFDHSTVTRLLKKFYFGLQEPQWSDKVR